MVGRYVIQAQLYGGNINPLYIGQARGLKAVSYLEEQLSGIIIQNKVSSLE